MAYNVRIFAHRGIDQMIVNKARQFSADSVFVLTQPYEWSQVISVSSVAAASAPVTDNVTTLLRIEVPDGQSIRYEINPPGRSVVASTNSPILSGHDQFYFRSGFSVSLIDAAGLP